MYLWEITITELERQLTLGQESRVESQMDFTRRIWLYHLGGVRHLPSTTWHCQKHMRRESWKENLGFHCPLSSVIAI